MKSKLTILGLCLFILSVQAAVAQANPAGAAAAPNLGRGANGSNATTAACAA